MKKFSDITFTQFVTFSALILFIVAETLSESQKIKIIYYAFLLVIFYGLIKIIIPSLKKISILEKNNQKEKVEFFMGNIFLEIFNVFLIGYFTSLLIGLLTYPNLTLHNYFSYIFMSTYILFLIETKNFFLKPKKVSIYLEVYLTPFILFLLIKLILIPFFSNFLEEFDYIYFFIMLVELLIGVIFITLLTLFVRIFVTLSIFERNNKLKYLRNEIKRGLKGFNFVFFNFLFLLFSLSFLVLFSAINPNTEIIEKNINNCTLMKDYSMRGQGEFLTYGVGVPIKDNYLNMSLKVTGILKKYDEYQILRVDLNNKKEYIQYFEFAIIEDSKLGYYIFKLYDKDIFFLEDLSIEVIEKTC